jgi:hypothetical protein
MHILIVIVRYYDRFIEHLPQYQFLYVPTRHKYPSWQANIRSASQKFLRVSQNEVLFTCLQQPPINC